VGIVGEVSDAPSIDSVLARCRSVFPEWRALSKEDFAKDFEWDDPKRLRLYFKTPTTSIAGVGA